MAAPGDEEDFTLKLAVERTVAAFRHVRNVLLCGV